MTHPLKDLMAEALTDEDTGQLPSPQLRKRAEFIRGPFNDEVYRSVANLGLAPLVVWQLIHHLSRLKHRSAVALPNPLLATFGIDRHAKYPAIKQLEMHGFITVTRRSGCAPRLSLVTLPETEVEEG
jgi:hypothetical protein